MTDADAQISDARERGTMLACFRLLTVTICEGVTCATVPHKRAAGYSDALLVEDFEQLSSACTPLVKLDLRSIEIIEDSFVRPLLELAVSVRTKGGKLTVQASLSAAEVIRVCALDKLFEVVTDSDLTQ